MQNFLITSSYSSSWKIKEKNYFLNYSASHGFDQKNYKQQFTLLKPYGNSIEEKKLNEEYINVLSAKIEKDLYKELNSIHSENNDLRFWKIIVGNWLNRAIKVIFYRYKCLERALDVDNNLVTTASKFGDYYFHTKESADINDVSLDSEWNYNLISNIIRFSFFNDIKVIDFKSKNKYFTKSNLKKNKSQILNYGKDFFFEVLKNIFFHFNKNNKFFFKNTSLPKLEELKLNIILNQIPIIYKTETLIPEKFDPQVRKSINIEKNADDSIEKVVRFLLPYLIPSTYLENYQYIKKISQSLKWPKNPKKIITGNSYDFDELFKIWTAHKVKEGSKYFIFQHGILHGNHIFSEQTNEYKVCDNFFYWGKKHNNEKKISMFNFKVLNKKIKQNKKFKLLIICKCQGYDNEAFDRVYEHSKIFDGLKTLVKNLPIEILNQTYFRVRELDNGNYNLEKNFLTSKNLNIIDSKENIFNYVCQSNLTVFLYNSTGILENLSLNIPTICHWPEYENSRNILDNEYFELIKKSEIFCETTQLMSKKIIDKADNINDWWNSLEVQKNRIKLCEKYSIIPNKNSLQKLSKEIKD
jgi:putative transferase (TIGR04331 family)